MQNSLSIAIIAGFGGMLGWGFADYFAKKAIDTVGDLAALFWSQLIGILPLVAYFILKPTPIRISGNAWPYLIALSLIEASSWLFTYNGFSKGDVSVLSPVFSSYAGLVVLISVFFYHESLSLHQLLAISIIFIGIILINGDPRQIINLFKRNRKHSKSGLSETLISVVIYSLWFVLFSHFINGRSWVIALIVNRSLVTVTVAIYSKFRKQSLYIKLKNNLSIIKAVSLLGLFDVGAYALVSYGFSVTKHVSIITILSGAFSLPTIILAYMYLKERISLLQISAALIIIGGVALLSLS